MVLTVVLALGIGLTLALGVALGVRLGLVALAGTLLAAVLIDLWYEPLAIWVREVLRPELPAAPTFAVVATVFLLAAAVVGYGSGTLLPRPGASAAGPGLVDRLVGALLGALNGALLAGYLLSYALEAWDRGAAADLVAASYLGSLLVAWLPWFVLGMVGATGALILARLARGLLARSSTRRAARAGSVAAARNLAEAEQRLSDKIDQAMGKK
ncbi:MAG: hypothetical protein HGA45_12375 [Chloroflexales bacterium]|nr:hypothetical protein [Chloroflexales bacterium]